MTKFPAIVIIKDSSGYEWILDGEYMWVKDADLEYEEGAHPSDYGYYCTSLEEAFKILIEGGYLKLFDEPTQGTQEDCINHWRYRSGRFVPC